MYFSNLNKVWEEVLHLGIRQVYPKNSIIQPNDDCFIYLQSGIIRLERLNSLGDETFVFIFQSGSIFNLMSFIKTFDEKLLIKINHMMPTFFYNVMSESVVYIFPSALLVDPKFMQAYPNLVPNLFVSTLYKQMLLANRLTTTYLNKPIVRVCTFLYNFHDEILNAHGNNDFSLTQTDLAKFLGLSRAELTRIISDLRSQNIIGEFTKNKLEILDKERLIALCKTC